MTMEAAAKATKNQGCRQKGFTPERYPYSKYLLEGVVICKKNTRVENLLSLFFFVVLLHTLSNVFSLKVTGHEQQQVVLESVLRKNCNSPNLRLLSKALTFLSNYKAKIFYAVLKFGIPRKYLFFMQTSTIGRQYTPNPLLFVRKIPESLCLLFTNIFECEKSWWY